MSNPSCAPTQPFPTHTTNGTATDVEQHPTNKKVTNLKIMTLNVRGLFKSHWDLRHAISTHNPNIMVFTETKLNRSNKPRTWMKTLLKGYKYWSAFDRTGGTTICVRNDLALAMQCTTVCINSKGRIASLILKGSNTNILLVGTYWPSGSSEEALTCRNQMQEEITSLMNTHSDCIPMIIGDMNATAQTNDRTSSMTYLADRAYRNFLSSNNLSPCSEETKRPWTH